MKIKKMYQGTVPENKIMNSYTESNTDAYSCEYINILNTYSTEEQRIGTWINSKPIYRKVISFNTTSSKINAYLTLNTRELNIEWLINAYGPAKQSDGSTIMLKSDTQAILLTSKGQLDLYFNNSTAQTFSGYVILEYTKTTD